MSKNNAELLTVLGRKRKHGSTEWSARDIYGILKNEKHCGDVLARKTYTPNYLDHKSKKNRQNRNQYRQKGHHQGIISREVFLAVQTRIDSHKQLPTLRVVDDGFLRGYVPVNLGWTGFSAEDYLAASESAPNPRLSPGLSVPEQDDAGFQIVRMQMFSTFCSPAVRISDTSIAFTSACMKKFADVEYVELLFHPVLKRLAVRPCDAKAAGAVHWGRQRSDRWIAYPRSATVFSRPLFQIMGWKAGNVYRICALCYRENGERLLLFDLSDAEVVRSKQKDGNTDVDTVKANPSPRPARIFPSAWAETFGPAAKLEKRRQEEDARLYANGRACGLTARTVEKLCPITEDDVNNYLSHAERIMERVGANNV